MKQSSTCWLAIGQGYHACCWCGGRRSRQITKAFKTRANNTRACAGFMIGGDDTKTRCEWNLRRRFRRFRTKDDRKREGLRIKSGLSGWGVQRICLIGRFVVNFYSTLVWAENVSSNLPSRGKPFGKGTQGRRSDCCRAKKPKLSVPLSKSDRIVSRRYD